MLNNEKIIDYARQIATEKTVYSYGDEWLYKMSQDSLRSCDDKAISSMIWIIGRSYAASPERQIKEYRDITSGELFRELAQKVKFNFFDRKRIQNSGYKYDNSIGDKKMLYDSIYTVRVLNGLFKEVSESEDTDNMISFCSKFLHFYFPQSFFIYDSYSSKGSKRIFNKRTKVVDIDGLKTDQWREAVEIGEYNELYDYVEKKIFCFKPDKDNKEHSALEPYCKHVCGCYILGKFLSENGIDGIQIFGKECSMPRLVDSILLKIGEY